VYVCIHDWCCGYGDSSDQILTSYTTCSNGTHRSISLKHAVKPTADVTVNVTTVAKTPKTLFRAQIFPSRSARRPTQNSSCDGERKNVWRMPLRRLVGEQNICCIHTTLRWVVSFTFRPVYPLSTPLPSGKIFNTHGKEGCRDPRGGLDVSEKAKRLCPCRESIPESSNTAAFLCTLLLNLFGYVWNSLFNDTFSGSKHRTSKGGVKGFGTKRYWPNLRCYPGIFVEGPRRTSVSTENLLVKF
jgi:hypothetical protein